MEQITVRLPSDVLESVESEAKVEHDNRSDYLRDVIESRHEADELRAEVEDLRAEVRSLRNQNRTLIEDREERKELVRYVEDERNAEQRRRSAPVWKRARWWLLGVDEE